jgi:hypothetical protein
LREGKLLSDSDPVWARCAYEDEPRQLAGGGGGSEQDPGPGRPADAKGGGHLCTGNLIRIAAAIGAAAFVRPATLVVI